MKNVITAVWAAAVLSGFAATYTWTGAGDATKWSDPANWGGSGCPTGGDTATFGAAATISEDFAVGDGVLTVSVASGKDVKLTGVVSGAGGVKKTGGGVLHLLNPANTYTGTTELDGGQLYYMSLANIGEPSSLGAPPAENAELDLRAGVLYMETQTDKSATYSCNRPVRVMEGVQFRTSFDAGVTVNLTGPFSGTGIIWRGLATINVQAFFSSAFTAMKRTDGGVVNLLCTTNEFQLGQSEGTVLDISDGSFRGTVAPRGVPSSVGAGQTISFGQQNYPTTGSFVYNGPTSTNCDRHLRIQVYTNGAYTANCYGARLVNETAGTCLTMNGTLEQNVNARYAAHNAPFLYLDGPGDGVFAPPLAGNITLDKRGTGTWALRGDSTSTGRVAVLEGRLDVDGSIAPVTGYPGGIKVAVGNACALGGTGTVHGATQIAIGGTLAPGHADALGTLAFGPEAMWMNASSTLRVRIGADTNDCVVSSGHVYSNGGQVNVEVTPFGVESIAPGCYTLIDAARLSNASFTLASGAPEGAYLAVLGNRLCLIVPNVSATQLTWTGAAGTAWDAASLNWLDGDAETVYTDGVDVSFTDASTVTNVTLTADVSPGAVTVASDTANYTFDGAGALTGPATFTKSGASALTLNGTYAHTLPTRVEAGKVVLNGTLNGSSLMVAHQAVFEQSAGSVIAGENVSLSFGWGSHALRGANTFSGAVVYSTQGGAPGTKGDVSLDLFGTSPLGRASTVTVTGWQSSYDTCTFLALHNGARVEDVLFKYGEQGNGYRAFLFKANDGGTGSWYGDVELTSGPQCYIRSDGGVLEVGRPGGTNEIRGNVGFSFRGGGTIHVHSRLNGTGSPNRDDGGTVVLFNTNNVFPNTSFIQGTYQLGAANAWCTNATMGLGKNSATGHSAFNLNGFDQTLPGLNENYRATGGANNTRRIYTPAGKPCTLTMANNGEDCQWGGSGWSSIEGPLALTKRGSRTFTLAGTNTFTGAATVEAGTLRAAVAQALGGTTNAVVAGGVLQLMSSDALNRDAVATFTAGGDGRILLGDGVVQSVYALFADGRQLCSGVYGSSQSAARIKDDTRFAGTGVLVVRTGGGTFLLIR